VATARPATGAGICERAVSRRRKGACGPPVRLRLKRIADPLDAPVAVYQHGVEPAGGQAALVSKEMASRGDELAALAWAMDRGERVTARISALREHRNPRMRIEFEVFVE